MSKTGIVADPVFLDHDTGEHHPERPERLSHIYQMIQDRGLAKATVKVKLREATDQELLRVHSPEHLRAIAATAGKSQTHLDGDTPTSPGSSHAARLAAGSLIECVDQVLAGQLKNAFALVRPPGHHAERSRAMGFCLFNNIAVAAAAGLADHGLSRILIVDWDVHHGNGTQHTFESEPRVLFFSTHRYPFYPGSGYLDEVGTGPGQGFTINVPLPPGCGDGEFNAVFEQVLLPAAEKFKPELVMVSAGFDQYHLDPLGGMRLTEAGAGRLATLVLEIANRFCGGKLVVTLEGGYHLEGLARCVYEVLGHMARTLSPAAAGEPPAEGFELLIEKVAEVQRPYWPGMGKKVRA
jgi:acetoin utilization deacetylase AcuC-like enzyme